MKNAELGVPFETPTELWVIMDVLQREGLSGGNIFGKSGSQAEIQMIRDALDTKKPDGQLNGKCFPSAALVLHPAVRFSPNRSAAGFAFSPS